MYRCLLLLLFCVSAHAQELRIVHIDVEQASATLLVAPGGKTLLIDSGKNGMGARLKAVMDDAGVTAIDFLVTTHYHEDHYGGIDDLVRLGVPVHQAYDRGDKAFLPARKRAESTFLHYQAAVGQDAQQLRRGMTLPLDPLMTVTCVAAGGVVIGEHPPVPGEEENDLSIALLITFGSFRYFVGGDIEAATETKLAARDLATDVEVYVANHHGSDTSSSLAFLEDLAPRTIIVSNGDHGTYKHPRQSVLNRYAQLREPPLIVQTNKCLKTAPCANVADRFIADPTTESDGTITIVADTRLYTLSFADGRAWTLPLRAISIESLVPNPAGDDAMLEQVTLRNTGSDTVSVAGWHLQDRSGLRWALDGSIAAGGTLTVSRNRMPMTLNNDGDEIILFDAEHRERGRFAYNAGAEGEVVRRTQ